MIKVLRTLFYRWFGARPSQSKPALSGTEQSPAHEDSGATGTQSLDRSDSGGRPVPYDEYLLEKARTQWQFGDWESLAKLDRDTLQHHPDRAKLALLAAAGRLQMGHAHAARHYLRLAEDWGCGRHLMTRVVISGVHNSLGRAASLAGQGQRAQLHFEDAIRAGMPTGDVRLLTQVRTQHQGYFLGGVDVEGSR